MKIQYISLIKKQFNRFFCSTFTSYQTIDSFDCNIIDLSDSDVWKCRHHSNSSIDCESELTQLCNIVQNSKKNNIVFLFPKNINFLFSGPGRLGDYSQSVSLKDNFTNFRNILIGCNVINKSVLFNFENNCTTLVNGTKVESSFYFVKNSDVIDPVLKADYSDKYTVVSYIYTKVFFSFVNLKNEEMLLAFLRSIGIESDAGNVPDWLNDYCVFNDRDLKEGIVSANNKIKNLSILIKSNEEELTKNLYYKEMLICNGDNLVERVYKALEEILDIDLSSFVDNKEADFVFEKSGVVFVGEIKGISTNVKNENISQVDVHESSYIDDLEENGQPTPCIKKLLIINHQRNKSVDEREPVNDKQKNLAIKNNVLIIETVTLIKLLEKYRSKELSRDSIIEQLKNSTGLLIVS